MLEKICKAEMSDLQDIAALESEIFSDAWSLKSLEETWNQKNAVIFAAKTEEKIAGYLIIYYVLDEGEIARIATAPSMRRQGAAGQMFQELVAFCEEQQITRIMLEVREGNEAARRFYEKCGFTEDGIRKKLLRESTGKCHFDVKKSIGNNGNSYSTFHWSAYRWKAII